MNPVIQAKKQYKNLYLLRIEEDHAVVFRTIPWSEYKSYRSLLTAFPAMEWDLKEALFQECVIEYASPIIRYKNTPYTMLEIDNGYLDMNDTLEYIPAGVVDVVSTAIMNLSGASDADKFFYDLEQVRSLAEVSLEERITSAVAAVFKYRQEDFDSMEWSDILKVITQGELILEGRVVEPPFRLSDDNDNQAPINFEKENRESTN